jgi:tripartite-type tricarboxylate transporter receptor subunit TctC
LANMLQQSAGIELQHVPFQGSGPLLPAVLGGHVDAAFMNVPEIRGQVDAGELRALAVLSEQRIDLMPDVPTAAEQGVAGVAGGAAHFIIIPNHVPDEVVARIDELTKAVYETDRFKELMEQAGYQIGYKTAEESRQEVKEWYEVTGEIYRSLGLIE